MCSVKWCLVDLGVMATDNGRESVFDGSVREINHPPQGVHLPLLADLGRGEGHPPAGVAEDESSVGDNPLVPPEGVELEAELARPRPIREPGVRGARALPRELQEFPDSVPRRTARTLPREHHTSTLRPPLQRESLIYSSHYLRFL